MVYSDLPTEITCQDYYNERCKVYDDKLYRATTYDELEGGVFKVTNMSRRAMLYDKPDEVRVGSNKPAKLFWMMLHNPSMSVLLRVITDKFTPVIAVHRFLGTGWTNLSDPIYSPTLMFNTENDTVGPFLIEVSSLEDQPDYDFEWDFKLLVKCYTFCNIIESSNENKMIDQTLYKVKPFTMIGLEGQSFTNTLISLSEYQTYAGYWYKGRRYPYVGALPDVNDNKYDKFFILPTANLPHVHYPDIFPDPMCTVPLQFNPNGGYKITYDPPYEVLDTTTSMTICDTDTKFVYNNGKQIKFKVFIKTPKKDMVYVFVPILTYGSAISTEDPLYDSKWSKSLITAKLCTKKNIVLTTEANGTKHETYLSGDAVNPAVDLENPGKDTYNRTHMAKYIALALSNNFEGYAEITYNYIGEGEPLPCTIYCYMLCYHWHCGESGHYGGTGYYPDDMGTTQTDGFTERYDGYQMGTGNFYGNCAMRLDGYYVNILSYIEDNSSGCTVLIPDYICQAHADVWNWYQGEYYLYDGIATWCRPAYSDSFQCVLNADLLNEGPTACSGTDMLVTGPYHYDFYPDTQCIPVDRPGTPTYTVFNSNNWKNTPKPLPESIAYISYPQILNYEGIRVPIQCMIDNTYILPELFNAMSYYSAYSIEPVSGLTGEIDKSIVWEFRAPNVNDDKYRFQFGDPHYTAGYWNMSDYNDNTIQWNTYNLYHKRVISFFDTYPDEQFVFNVIGQRQCFYNPFGGTSTRVYNAWNVIRFCDSATLCENVPGWVGCTLGFFWTVTSNSSVLVDSHKMGWWYSIQPCGLQFEGDYLNCPSLVYWGQAQRLYQTDSKFFKIMASNLLNDRLYPLKQLIDVPPLSTQIKLHAMRAKNPAKFTDDNRWVMQEHKILVRVSGGKFKDDAILVWRNEKTGETTPAMEIKEVEYTKNKLFATVCVPIEKTINGIRHTLWFKQTSDKTILTGVYMI